MTIQSDLRACLLSLVGAVHFDVLPLDVVPPVAPGWSAIVIAADIATTDAAVCDTSDSDTHRFQVDVYAPLVSQVLTLRPLVFAAIQTKFPAAVRVNDMSAYDDDTKLYRRIIEYLIPE